MKVLHCKDAGFDCDAVIREKDDQEVLGKAGVHAKEVHGIDATPEMQEQLKRLIREE